MLFAQSGMLHTRFLKFKCCCAAHLFSTLSFFGLVGFIKTDTVLIVKKTLHKLRQKTSVRSKTGMDLF